MTGVDCKEERKEGGRSSNDGWEKPAREAWWNSGEWLRCSSDVPCRWHANRVYLRVFGGRAHALSGSVSAAAPQPSGKFSPAARRPRAARLGDTAEGSECPLPRRFTPRPVMVTANTRTRVAVAAALSMNARPSAATAPAATCRPIRWRCAAPPPPPATLRLQCAYPFHHHRRVAGAPAHAGAADARRRLRTPFVVRGGNNYPRPTPLQFLLLPPPS